MTDPFAAIAQPAQPSTPPPTSGGDPFAAIAKPVPQQPAQQPPAPASPMVPLSQDLQTNPNGEGTYSMTGPKGEQLSVPHSKVALAQQNGYNFGGDTHFNPWWLIPGSVMGKKSHVSDEESRYNRNELEGQSKRWAQDPNSQQLMRQSGVVGLETGAAREAARTAVGAGDLVRDDQVSREMGNIDRMVRPGQQQPQQPQGPSAVRQFADDPNRTGDEAIGGGAENMAEFFTGQELLGLMGKAVRGSEALKGASQLSTVLDKYPVVAKYLKIGLESAKQGLIGGGQTFVKTGGDLGAAAEAGGLQTLIAGGTGAAFNGVADAAAKRATTLEKVGGVETPIPAEVRNQTPTPQQVAGQESIQKAAQDVTRRHLEEVNETRTAPPSNPALPASTGPYKFKLQIPGRDETTSGQLLTRAAEVPKTESYAKPSGKSPQNAELGSVSSTVPNRLLEREVPGYKTSSAPGEPISQTDYAHPGQLVTQDPNVARAHIAHLNKAIEGPDFENFPPEQQRQLLDARKDAQQQMGAYHQRVTQNLQHVVYGNEPSSVLRPIDIQQTVRKVGSFSDAADTIEKTAVDGYKLLNDVTGDRFNAIREANKDAWNAYKGASGEEAQEAARQAVEKTNQQMGNLLDGLRGIVDDRMLDGFNDAYRNAQNLRKVSQAVDSTFSGNPLGSKRSWEYRGFDGAALMKNLSKLSQDMGTGALTRLIGEDNLHTLFQVAELNRTQAQRAQFGQAVSQVARFVAQPHVSGAGIGAAAGWHTTHTWQGAAAGAAIGGATGAATAGVMRSVLTNPKIAKNLIFALQSGARPEKYGPFIAEMIQKNVTDVTKEEQHNADQTR